MAKRDAGAGRSGQDMLSKDGPSKDGPSRDGPSKVMPGRDAAAREMSESQLAYEARRAAKAGMSLDKWLDQKRRAEAREKLERERAVAPPPPPKKPGFISRLIDRAHKPL